MKCKRCTKKSLCKECQANELAKAAWYQAVDDFMAQHPEILKDETLTKAFDAYVKEETLKTMLAGGLPGIADLEKAHNRYLICMSIS